MLTPRREWVVVGALTFLAAIVRFWGFGRLGLTHFDEGVYALAGLWSVTGDGINAVLIAYGPPGYPILLGLAYAVLGVSDAAALLVSMITGVLAVPLAAWLARRTFGPGAGAVAAAIVALAAAHVAFSRKALTDAPFLLCWLVAMGLGGRFLERPGARRAILFGLSVGLAQNFKYHGWLAGAVIILALVCGSLRRRDGRNPSALVATLGWGLVAIVAAGVSYLPWFLFVESHGGYADLLRHQRGYFLGPAAWLNDFQQQMAQVVALSGGPVFSAVAWVLAWLACMVVLGLGKDRCARPWVVLGVGAIVATTVPTIGWWIGLAAVPWLILDERPARRVLGAWWVSQSILTPLYHPYARLWLPLHAAGWIVIAGATVETLRSERRLVGGERRTVASLGYLALVLVIGKWHAATMSARPIPIREILGPTDLLRSSIQRLKGPRDVILGVLGRRPIAFYLAFQGSPPFRLVSGGPAAVPEPAAPGRWLLLDGALDASTLDPVKEALDRDRSWKLVEEFPGNRLDPVTRLDVDPRSALGDRDAAPRLFLYGPANERWERGP